MMLTGNGSVSIRKKDLDNQKVPATGFQKTVFAHKATAGQTGINLASLTTPSELTSNGFSQPSVGELQNANLLFYRNNLKLVSSIRGQLIDFLSYTVAGSTQINFLGFTALQDEIFTGTIDYNAVSGVKVVDASPIVATGTLAANTTDFNTGSPFKVNMYPTAQVGAVIVYLDGIQQFRNTGNSSSVLDGNYYEVDAGAGLGVIIRFNNADSINARSVMVTSNGILSERPDGSMMATIESVQGQVNSMASVVSDLSGLTETQVIGASPSNVDLKAFGDRVLDVENRYAKKDTINTFTQPQLIPGRTDGVAVVSPYIGQVVSATLSNVALTDVAGSVKTVGTLTLPAGNWMVYGLSTCNPAGTTTTYFDVSIGTVLDTHRTSGVTRTPGAGSAAPRLAAQPFYISTTGQNVYLTVDMLGTGTVPSTVGASSELYAIRMP